MVYIPVLQPFEQLEDKTIMGIGYVNMTFLLYTIYRWQVKDATSQLTIGLELIAVNWSMITTGRLNADG